MTPEQQRIAIAKACGWKSGGDSRNWTWFRPDGRGWNGNLPDYLNDLNAMHDAEKSTFKTSTQWDCYASFLEPMLEHQRGFYLGASAAQRAEAFLKTLGLWTSEPPEHKQKTKQ